jgi:hypothetical protein
MLGNRVRGTVPSNNLKVSRHDQLIYDKEKNSEIQNASPSQRTTKPMIEERCNREPQFNVRYFAIVTHGQGTLAKTTIKNWILWLVMSENRNTL